jgi:hypothetical protein
MTILCVFLWVVLAGVAKEMMKRGAMLTVLSSLLTALAWPATLLGATDFIDSKWTLALNRLGNPLLVILHTQSQRDVSLILDFGVLVAGSFIFCQDEHKLFHTSLFVIIDQKVSATSGSQTFGG